MEVYGVPLAEFQFSQHGVPAELIASVHEFFQAEGGDLVAGHAAAGAEAFAFAVEVVQGHAHQLFIRFAVVVHHDLTYCLFFGNAGFVAMPGKQVEQGAKVIAPFPVFQLFEGTVQGGFEEDGEGLGGRIAGGNAHQRVCFGLFPLAEGGLVGHGQRLFQTERDGRRIVIGTVIERHAAALLHGRFFQCDGVGEQGLVTVYGEPVGSGMKQPDFFFLPGARTVGGGKQYPYFYASSAASAKGGKSLRQQGRLALYLLHFHGIGQVVDFNLYQSVVGFQVSFPLFAAGIFCGRADAWQFVYAGVVSVASGDVGNEAAQGGYVSGFVLGFHLLHQGAAGPCAECLFAGFTSGAYKGKFHGVLAVLKSAKLLKNDGTAEEKWNYDETSHIYSGCTS